MKDKPLDPSKLNPGVARGLNPGKARGELVHEWTHVEKPKRERIRLRWPRLAELLDNLAASS